MRTRQVALVWAFVLGLASGNMHNHLHRMHKKAQTQSPARVTVEDPAITTPTEVPEVLVYLDKDGKPTSTATEMVMLVPTSAAAETKKTVDAVDKKLSDPSKSNNSSPSVKDTGSGLHGVTYSPYRSDGTCKSAGEISSDLQQLEGTVSLIRIYGVDCNQVNTVMPAVVNIGAKIFLGLFNLDSLDTDIQDLVDGVKNNGGWSHVDTVSVGNELVNNGQATPQQMIDAVTSTRSSLRSAGYQGPVVTVDTFIAAQKHPEICDASDYCAINTHPFFDSTCEPGNAGDWVSREVATTRSKLADPNKRVVVTETGWPSQGTANGAAVPSKENQAIATKSILSVYGSKDPRNLIMFTAFDDGWKKAEPGTFYAEQFWGMYSQ